MVTHATSITASNQDGFGRDMLNLYPRNTFSPSSDNPTNSRINGASATGKLMKFLMNIREIIEQNPYPTNPAIFNERVSDSGNLSEN